MWNDDRILKNLKESFLQEEPAVLDAPEAEVAPEYDEYDAQDWWRGYSPEFLRFINVAIKNGMVSDDFVGQYKKLVQEFYKEEGEQMPFDLPVVK